MVGLCRAVTGARSAPRGSPAALAGAEEQTPSWAFNVPLIGLWKDKCTSRHHGHKPSWCSSALTAGSGALAAEHRGTAGTSLRITWRRKQTHLGPIGWEPLKTKIIVRGHGYNPEKTPLKTHVPFVPTLTQTGHQVILVNGSPDVLNSADSSIWSH